MGKSIHQFSIDGPHSPVKATTHQFHHILLNKGVSDYLISDVYLKTLNKWEQITPQDIIPGSSQQHQTNFMKKG